MASSATGRHGYAESTRSSRSDGTRKSKASAAHKRLQPDSDDGSEHDGQDNGDGDDNGYLEAAASSSPRHHDAGIAHDDDEDGLDDENDRDGFASRVSTSSGHLRSRLDALASADGRGDEHDGDDSDVADGEVAEEEEEEDGAEDEEYGDYDSDVRRGYARGGGGSRADLDNDDGDVDNDGDKYTRGAGAGSVASSGRYAAASPSAHTAVQGDYDATEDDSELDASRPASKRARLSSFYATGGSSTSSAAIGHISAPLRPARPVPKVPVRQAILQRTLRLCGNSRGRLLGPSADSGSGSAVTSAAAASSASSEPASAASAPASTASLSSSSFRAASTNGLPNSSRSYSLQPQRLSADDSTARTFQSISPGQRRRLSQEHRSLLAELGRLTSEAEFAASTIRSGSSSICNNTSASSSSSAPSFDPTALGQRVQGLLSRLRPAPSDPHLLCGRAGYLPASTPQERDLMHDTPPGASLPAATSTSSSQQQRQRQQPEHGWAVVIVILWRLRCCSFIVVLPLFILILLLVLIVLRRRVLLQQQH